MHGQWIKAILMMWLSVLMGQCTDQLSSLILIVCFCVCLPVMSNLFGAPFPLWGSWHYRLPVSSVHGISRKVLERFGNCLFWGDHPYPRIKPYDSCVLWIGRQTVSHCFTRGHPYTDYIQVVKCVTNSLLQSDGHVYSRLCIEKNWATQWIVLLIHAQYSMARLVCMTIHVLILTNSGRHYSHTMGFLSLGGQDSLDT